MCYLQVQAVGRITDGTGSENDVESPLDMVKAPHSVQQPVDVAKGNHSSTVCRMSASTTDGKCPRPSLNKSR